MNIKVLTEKNVKEFWDLRMIALKEKNVAFGSSYEEEIKVSNDIHISRYKNDFIYPLENNFVLGAFNDQDQLMGIVGFRREKRIRSRHKASIWGMYVLPEYRGTGVGKKLLTELINIAKDIIELEQVNLAVVSNNEQAKRLYTSLGFQTYGKELHALKVDHQYYDEDYMMLFLNK